MADNRRFVILVLLVAGAIVAAYLVLTGPGGLGAAPRPAVKEVPRGDREIAWIHTATSGAAWERFVAGVRLAEQLHPQLGLTIEDQNAFPAETAAVPELALRLPGGDARLWIRWYKQTSDAAASYWVKELAARSPAPLAVIGGSTTDRALELAQALNEQTGWQGDRPLFLITTATADKVRFQEDLMQVYPGRSFRFSFTNSQMAEAVVDFAWRCGHFGNANLSLAGVGQLAGGDAFAGMGLLAAGLQPTFAPVFTIEWADDPFSLDLSHQFRAQLRGGNKAAPGRTFRVPFSVGDYHRPNPPEAALIEELLGEIARSPERRPLLVLPAGLRPARRFLRTLASAAPVEVRDLVVLSGDSISFNNIYRDREIAWHIQDIPLPLVLFCHENPVLDPPRLSAASAGLVPNNGTDDLLLNAVIVQMVWKACFPAGKAGLVPEANDLAERLHECRLPESGVPFFDAAGNRRGGSGEHVVCLLPHRAGGRVLPRATLEVWTRRPADDSGPRWQLVKALPVSYGEPPSGGTVDAEP